MLTVDPEPGRAAHARRSSRSPARSCASGGSRWRREVGLRPDRSTRRCRRTSPVDRASRSPRPRRRARPRHRVARASDPRPRTRPSRATTRADLGALAARRGVDRVGRDRRPRVRARGRHPCARLASRHRRAAAGPADAVAACWIVEARGYTPTVALRRIPVRYRTPPQPSQIAMHFSRIPSPDHGTPFDRPPCQPSPPEDADRRRFGCRPERSSDSSATGGLGSSATTAGRSGSSTGAPCRKGVFDQLNEGQRVSFDEEPSNKGPRANNIQADA